MKKSLPALLLIISIIFLAAQILIKIRINQELTTISAVDIANYIATSTSVDATFLAIPDISKTKKAQLAARDKLIAMLDPNDSDSVYKIVDIIQASPSIAQNCHEMAHDIGHAAYEMYGFAGAVNFSRSDPSIHRSVQDICAGGYIHGVLEEAALHKPDFRKDPGAMCKDVNVENSDNCYHGVGHALMFSYWRDVPQSLAGCRSTGYISHHTRCFEGVWMELFWGNAEATTTKDLGWDILHPLELCKATDNDAKPACYIYSVLGYLRTHKKDYNGAIDICIKSNLNDSDSHFCVKGVGIMVVRNLRENKPEVIEHYAANLDRNQKLGYYSGLLGYADLAGISMESLTKTCELLKKDSDICKQVLSGIKK